MRPLVQVYLNDEDVTDKWGPVISSVSVTDEAGIKADTCEFVFDNRSEFAAPKIGSEIRVWMGYAELGTLTYLGRYKVSSWSKSGPRRVLSVSAKAADLTSKIRAPRTRSWHDKTIKEIVEAIAGDHKLEALIDKTIGARKIEHIDQQTESDVSFLTRLASRNGAMFKLADGKLLFAAKGSRKNAAGNDKTPIKVLGRQISRWDAMHDKRGDYKSVSAEYMDHKAGKRKSAIAGSGEPRFRDRRLYGSQAEAQAAAEAKLGDLTRGQMTVDLDMPGDPRLFAEALVQLVDVDGDVDGEYLAKSVTHSFSGRGYVTTLSLETEGAAKEGDDQEE